MVVKEPTRFGGNQTIILRRRSPAGFRILSVPGMNINDLWICAETLAPYATEFRYLSDLLEPEKEDAEEAIEMTTQVYSFVLQNLPSEYSFFVPS